MKNSTGNSCLFNTPRSALLSGGKTKHSMDSQDDKLQPANPAFQLDLSALMGSLQQQGGGAPRPGSLQQPGEPGARADSAPRPAWRRGGVHVARPCSCQGRSVCHWDSVFGACGSAPSSSFCWHPPPKTRRCVPPPPSAGAGGGLSQPGLQPAQAFQQQQPQQNPLAMLFPGAFQAAPPAEAQQQRQHPAQQMPAVQQQALLQHQLLMLMQQRAIQAQQQQAAVAGLPPAAGQFNNPMFAVPSGPAAAALLGQMLFSQASIMGGARQPPPQQQQQQMAAQYKRLQKGEPPAKRRAVERDPLEAIFTPAQLGSLSEIQRASLRAKVGWASRELAAASPPCTPWPGGCLAAARRAPRPEQLRLGCPGSGAEHRFLPPPPPRPRSS